MATFGCTLLPMLLAAAPTAMNAAMPLAAPRWGSRGGRAHSNLGLVPPPRRVQEVERSETMKEANGGVHPDLWCSTDLPCGWVGKFCSFKPYAVENIYAESWGFLDQEHTGQCDSCPVSTEGCHEMNLTDLALEDCLNLCEPGRDEGDNCTSNDLCRLGLFCNFENGDSGTCEKCRTESLDCLSGDIVSEMGMESCLQCKLKCREISWGSVTLAGGEGLLSDALSGSPAKAASGPLVDCSSLVLDDVDTCMGANNSICLVEDIPKDSWNFELVWKCERSGGVALVLFGDYDDQPADMPTAAWLGQETNIPSVSISYKDGKHLQEAKLGSGAHVSVEKAGDDICWIDQPCSKTIPCVGKNDGGYCEFIGDTDEGYWCNACPVDENGDPDPYACFFADGGYPKEQNEVESCAANCASSLEIGGDCKLCGESVTGMDFGVKKESDRCYFCPQQDVKHPDREVPLFGQGTKCWQVQSFFNKIDVPKDSKNCRLVQLQNYICGCEGPGYGGASEQGQRAALVWVPRVMAILSLLGSSFIVCDSLKRRERRQKVFYQLMIMLGIFDMIGSLAYAFTSLPIPSEYYFYGSAGNDQTCTAQGFFIQVGTTSCYTNVSLAVYYFLVITKGWSEADVKKIRIWLFLCPILVGMAFAFAGIPFYDNMILWCNNAASWWPDIPVAIAIFAATAIMGTVCWNVRQAEKASERWRGGSTRNSLSKKVFWQSLRYLMAFYLTWPPYLALQYSWASGSSFGNYGFILFAGTMVPLQGLWNAFVFARPRYAKIVSRGVSSFFLTLRENVTTVAMQSRASGRNASVAMQSRASGRDASLQDASGNVASLDVSGGKDAEESERPRAA